jgi:hypothetical protein
MSSKCKETQCKTRKINTHAYSVGSADIKSTGFSFGIRLPNGLAPNFPRPVASVSHSKIRCAIVAHCKAWISNSRQMRAGKETSSLCFFTIQPKGKYSIMHRCYGDESGVVGRLQRAREVICARPRFPRPVGAPTSVNCRRICRKSV